MITRPKKSLIVDSISRLLRVFTRHETMRKPRRRDRLKYLMTGDSEPFCPRPSTSAPMAISLTSCTILLILFLYACIACASPVSSTEIVSSHTPRADDETCDSLTRCRTTWSIVWSCFTTTIACIWVSVHPNIPAANDSEWTVRWRKVGLASLVFMAPEYIVLLAFFQWQSARKLVAGECR